MIFLRTALGKDAVPQPEINVGSAFKVAANAALGTTLKPSFMPYKVRNVCSGSGNLQQVSNVQSDLANS